MTTQSPAPAPRAAPSAPPTAKSTDQFRLRLRAIYLDHVRPFLDGQAILHLESPEFSGRQFDDWRAQLPAEYHSVLEELQNACDLSREMDRQARLHARLHSWLMVHIPLSIALIVLLFVHVYTALRVIPL